MCCCLLCASILRSIQRWREWGTAPAAFISYKVHRFVVVVNPWSCILAELVTSCFFLSQLWTPSWRTQSAHVWRVSKRFESAYLIEWHGISSTENLDVEMASCQTSGERTTRRAATVGNPEGGKGLSQRSSTQCEVHSAKRFSLILSNLIRRSCWLPDSL